jgi:copper(I)-binding protein
VFGRDGDLKQANFPAIHPIALFSLSWPANSQARRVGRSIGAGGKTPVMKSQTNWWIVGATVLGMSAGPGTTLAQSPKPEAAKPDAKDAVVTIVMPWARATPGGAKVGAAFLEIQAKPGFDDKLTSASSPAADVVELHDHVSDGGVMRMRKVEAIPLPGGKSVTLKPGGLHIMLIDLKAPLKEGDTIDLTLKFEKAGSLPVKVPVQKVGAMGGPTGSDHGSGSGSGSDHRSGSGMGSGSGSQPAPSNAPAKSN